MRTTVLGGALPTTVLGFGCASLFRDPSPRARRRVLDAAYDSGIRHFDVAPMYGLGDAEAELGEFARDHPDGLVLATKFGIEPTAFARGLARLQGPIRAQLRRSTTMQRRAQAAARGPRDGIAGGLLYRASGYDGRAARSALQKSLRHLARGHVDLFLLHDASPRAVPADVAEYLEDARGRGLIRLWGVAGPTRDALAIAGRLGPRSVVQVPFDGMRRDDFAAAASWPGGSISYGVVDRVLKRIGSVDPASRRKWSDAVGVDVGDLSQLAAALVVDASRSNPSGVVLYSTTRPDRIAPIVRAVEDEATWMPHRLATFRSFLAGLDRLEPPIEAPGG